MRFSHFFIDRPIFAAVISLIITIVGAIAYLALPVSEYPEIAPPTVVVSASYPGASAEVVADTVAAPLEQQINGVEGMLYISSQSTGNGTTSINVVFALGTDIDRKYAPIRRPKRRAYRTDSTRHMRCCANTRPAPCWQPMALALATSTWPSLRHRPWTPPRTWAVRSF